MIDCGGDFIIKCSGFSLIAEELLLLNVLDSLLMKDSLGIQEHTTSDHELI